MRTGDNYGQQFVDVITSDPDEIKFNMWLSTFNHELAIASTSCTSCNVKNKYDPKKSSTYKDLGTDIKNVATRFVKGVQLQDSTISGTLG